MTTPPDIPGYQIQSILGEGGMATVYLAEQVSLERQVALKVMNASLLVDKSFCERFLVEGKTVAKLKHPAIVNIYDIGCHDSIYYMAMEYVEGGCLTDKLKSSVGAMEAVAVIRSIAGALGYAHEHGIIHRDIKPANILFREGGEATLTDFGIAKAVASDKQLTQIGYAIGTPEYMSPEQARAAEIDGRSDLYSLGIVFYELLTGRRPFTSDDAFSTALMHLNKPVPVLGEHLAVYQPVIDSLLAKNPEDRYADARQLMRALDSFSEGHKTVEYGLDTDQRTTIAPSRVYQNESGQRPAGSTAVRGREAETVVDIEGRQEEPVFTQDATRGTLKTPGNLVRIGLPLSAVALLVLGVLGYYLYGESRVEQSSAVSVELTAEPSLPTEVSVNQDRIKRLLQGAEAHVAIGRLREPPGANAYDAYQMVLGLDPSNKRAQQGIRAIEDMEPAN